MKIELNDNQKLALVLELYNAGDISNALKIVESYRPKGKWVEHKNNLDIYYCSECGTDALYYFGNPFGEYKVFQVKSEYCPCCGADMRGKK